MKDNDYKTSQLRTPTHYEHNLFIGMKIDTADTISSIIQPIKVKIKVTFLLSDEKIEDELVLY